MRKNLPVSPCVYPEPVFIIATYDENEKPDAMNVAWGGLSAQNKLSFCVGKAHKTTANIKHNKAFTVSMGTAEQIVACDYVGIVSGYKDPDKFEKAGFHAIKSDFINAPIIEELGMCLECKLVSYEDESGTLIGEIVNISVDEAILTDGKIDPMKLNPIVFDTVNKVYWTLGKEVGKAFLDGKKLS